MKLKSIGLALTVSALVAGTATAQDDNVVNVYNWAEYTAPDTIPGFERETGIKIRYDTYDTNDILQAKLLTGNSGYDVVVPATHYAARQIEAGLLQKLDKSKIPNWEHLDPEIMAVVAQVDPGNEYLVPWGYGTNGLGYNVTKVKEIMGDDYDFRDWSNLFDPAKVEKLRGCGVSILDEAAQVFPAVLHYLGKDPNSSEEADYREAIEVLKNIRPYVRQFSSSGYIDELASGDLCFVYGYNGDVMIASDRAKEANRDFEVAYFTPNDGAPVWFDTMAVPKDAPNFDNAMKFINYIETPEVHAAITNEMFFTNANKTAREHVLPEIAANEELYPNAEKAKTLFVIKPQPMKILRLQTRLWAELKAGR